MLNFNFVYSIDKYLTEMQTWLVKAFTFENDDYDDRYTIIKMNRNRDNILFDDIWLLE